MAFEKEKESLNTSKCYIKVDFKENLRIGRGRVEFKKDFYNYNQLSVLGFSVINKDHEGDQVIKYYDFVSEILSHDSLFAGDCLLELFNLPEMKKISDVSIWTDGGPYFRSFELLHFIFS